MSYKTGWRTTEFWTTAVAPLVALFLQITGLVDFEPQADAIIEFGAVLGPAVYALSRALVKRG